MFYFRARKREPKRVVESRISTPEEKRRRHRNKQRIWRRAVIRLAQMSLESVNRDAASLEAAS